MNGQPSSHRQPQLKHATIYLLRHGAVDLPENAKRYVGWQDVTLSERGREQAHAWGKHFGGCALDAICCSTLSRCRETARIIAERCNLRLQALPALREIHLGSWEGQDQQTIMTRYPRAYRQRGEQIADYRPPGGESFRDLQKRVWPAFESVARKHGPTLIVSHAGVIRVLLCRLLEIPLQHLFHLRQIRATLTIVTKGAQGYCVEAINLPCPERI